MIFIEDLGIIEEAINRYDGYFRKDGKEEVKVGMTVEKQKSMGRVSLYEEEEEEEEISAKNGGKEEVKEAEETPYAPLPLSKFFIEKAIFIVSRNPFFE